jgi:proton-dependent oligopeptide transporter, POT family
VLLYVAFVGVCAMLLRVGARSDSVQRDRIFSLIALMVFNIGFWACFEQAGTSLTLFADRSVDRTIDSIGWELPASVVSNSFNSGFIILFGPVFSLLWLRLETRGRNPSIPIKFALGLVQLGLGFLVILLAASMADADSKVPLVFLVLMYMLHTTGELCISPIGLSMVTKLAPKSMTGTVMGAWFLTFSLGNFLAGKIAAYTGAEIDGDTMTAPQLLDRYTGIYGNVGWVLLGIGGLLFLLSGQLRRWMHGVK